MKELSLNILDVAENSIKAKATNVSIEIVTVDDYLTIKIDDNGHGMSEEFLRGCTDPFITTRSSRKVGMGLPLLKMHAEQADGEFAIKSTINKGTSVLATFMINHIDRCPIGNLPSTMVTLFAQSGYCDIEFLYQVEDRKFFISTKDIKNELSGIDIDEPEILTFLGDMIKENIEKINKGVIL